MDDINLLKVLDATPAEQISPGFKIKWLFNQRLLYVIGDSSQRADIDLWFKFMSTVIRDWPNNYTYLAVQDLSSPKFSLTPYAQSRASKTYEVRPTLTGRVAILMPRNFTGQMLQLFMRTQRRNHFETRFFTKPGDALA
ncbi:MAG TPA: hypothetical protein VKQ72_08675 [Aggregatilineales bacterium]|nr:hypothetical protein [Aggregatilineales bacterium]